MEKSIVSVIVAVYKVEEYLPRCVDSIINQSYSGLEIILVDDGSPDNSGKICDHYAELDARVKVIHKANSGVGDTRNVGISAVTGEYFLFVDSDDYIAPDLVERTVKAAHDYQAQIIIFDSQCIDVQQDTATVYDMKLPRNCPLSLEQNPFMLTVSPSPWDKLINTDFWINTGIKYPVGVWYEDLQAIPKLFFYADKVVYLDSPPLYYYMIRQGSIMKNSNFKKNFHDRTAAIDELLHFFREKGQYVKYQNELEYVLLLNGYYTPCREIILEDYKNKFLEQFRQYALNRFPHLMRNPYIQNMTRKDKLLLSLLYHKHYLLIKTLFNGSKIARRALSK